MATAQRAAVLVGPRRLSVREIPEWNLADYDDPDLVLLDVKACGVCGSDFRYWAGENPWSQHTLGRFVPNPPNIVLGHEYAGVVTAVASPDNAHLIGKRVAPVCSKVCGRCEDCRAGRTRLCPYTVHLGHGQGWGERAFYPGAYARTTLSWGATCFPISDRLTFGEAAMMDILAVCLHVAEVGQVQPGRPVLCLGAGPAGNGIAQVSRLLGADRAVLMDVSPVALEMARRQAVGEAVDVNGHSYEEARDRLRAFAPSGYGTVFDTIGTADSVNLALDVLGRAGTLVNVAMHDEAISLPMMRLGGERRMVTSCNFEVGDYPRALAWLEAGALRVREWLTPVTLDELPEWFEGYEKGRRAFKLLVDPSS